MIFVSEATCRHSVSRFPNMRSPFLLSIIAHIVALTNGAGLSNSNFYYVCRTSELLGLISTLILELFCD